MTLNQDPEQRVLHPNNVIDHRHFGALQGTFGYPDSAS